jgi:site-specific recombinase XerD
MNKIIELFRKELLELACLKDGTTRIYIDMVYKYADYANKYLKIDPLSTKTCHLNKWMYYLKKNNKQSNFMKNCKAALKRFFTFLVNTGYIKKNPAQRLPRVRKPKSDLNKPISTCTAFKLLKSFDRKQWMGMRNFSMVSLLWALGLRVNELITLKRCDINLDYDPENKIGILLVHGKGGKERTLFIVHTLYHTIIRYLNLKNTPKSKNSLLFQGNKGKSIGSSRVRQLIQEAAKRTGITERVTPHVFRHTFATDMYNQNVPLEVIKEMMGHETLRETSVYIHITEELKTEVLKKIGIKEIVS